jgi:hypothetical protein
MYHPRSLTGERELFISLLLSLLYGSDSSFAAAKNPDHKDFADLRFIEELDKSGYIDSPQ